METVVGAKLRKVISGMQTGVDIAALDAAINNGYEVSGYMPSGYRTLDGKRPEYKDKYNARVTKNWGYKTRTWLNIKNTSATARIASDFNSAGERCTLNGIREYQKPHFDVHVKLSPLKYSFEPKDMALWIMDNEFETLNCAGNSEQTSPGIYKAAYDYFNEVFRMVKNGHIN